MELSLQYKVSFKIESHSKKGFNVQPIAFQSVRFSERRYVDNWEIVTFESTFTLNYIYLLYK